VASFCIFESARCEALHTVARASTSRFLREYLRTFVSIVALHRLGFVLHPRTCWWQRCEREKTAASDREIGGGGGSLKKDSE
jgi:hypothetical protein